MIKSKQLELINISEAQRCQDVVSRVLCTRLSCFKNADFYGEHWKNISGIPISRPHIATPKMKVYDLRVMEAWPFAAKKNRQLIAALHSCAFVA